MQLYTYIRYLQKMYNENEMNVCINGLQATCACSQKIYETLSTTMYNYLAMHK